MTAMAGSSPASRWLQTPAISPCRPPRRCFMDCRHLCSGGDQHLHRHGRQHRGRHRAPRAQPHRGGQEDSWKGQGAAGTPNSSTQQPPPFLSQLPLAAPAPAGDIGTSPAPGQLLRAGGAAERARAHLRGCQSARAERTSTAAFQQDEHGPFQVSGSVGQGGPRSPISAALGFLGGTGSGAEGTQPAAVPSTSTGAAGTATAPLQ